MTNNILITGATGFIGEHTANYLKVNGYNVHALVRPNSNITYIAENIAIYTYCGNIEELANYIAEKEISIVLHIASMFVAEHDQNQIGILVDSNIKFGMELLEAMRIAGIKCFINTSSTWQHFDSNSSNYNPTNLYAATKEAFEKVIDYYVNVQDFKSITLTIYDSYGPNDRRGKFISLLNKFADEQIELLVSQGEQEIALTHIKDIVNAYRIAIERIGNTKGHERYALKPAEVYTLKQIVNFFEKQSGKKLNINWGARPYRKREVMKVWNCGQVLPNWEPKIDLAQGFKLMESECK